MYSVSSSKTHNVTGVTGRPDHPRAAISHSLRTGDWPKVRKSQLWPSRSGAQEKPAKRQVWIPTNGHGRTTLCVAMCVAGHFGWAAHRLCPCRPPHMITYTSRKVCRLNDLPNHVRPSFARCLSMSLEGRRGAGVGVTAALPMDEREVRFVLLMVLLLLEALLRDVAGQ